MNSTNAADMSTQAVSPVFRSMLHLPSSDPTRAGSRFESSAREHAPPLAERSRRAVRGRRAVGAREVAQVMHPVVDPLQVLEPEPHRDRRRVHEVVCDWFAGTIDREQSPLQFLFTLPLQSRVNAGHAERLRGT